MHLVLKLVFVVNVKNHRSQQYQSFNHLLPVDTDTHNGHAVVHDAHDESPDYRPQDFPDAARG